MKIEITLLIILFTVAGLLGQTGKKERIKVHSLALEGNLIGDDPTRDVTVYLPASYQTKVDKRFPVLYMLHGFSDTDSKWFGWEDHWINLHDLLDESMKEEDIREMIVVMPNAYNRFKGSMYSSSPTIGDWETFVASELVSYIDDHYRTLPDRGSRGLAGHSMGGYGSIRLGMKFPEVFSSIYMLSPCCMEGQVTDNQDLIEEIQAVDEISDLEGTRFRVLTHLASSAAWAPNPDNPPFYLDLPFDSSGVRYDIASKLAANRTLYTIEQHLTNVKKLTAIGMDTGLNDGGITIATKKLHELLTRYGIEHEYESYEGNHVNRIVERIQTKVLPFFSHHLQFE